MVRLDSGPPPTDQVARQVARLAHRGTAAVEVEGAAILAGLHRPEELGPPIRRDPAGGLIAVADARLDGRAALAADLGLDGSAPDVDVILAAYSRWGGDCAEHLSGDFAFAVWDGRRRELFCARDRVGVKQMYYHRSNSLLVLASEIKGVLAVAGVPRRVNRVRVADHLLDVMDDVRSTLFADVFSLAPAHTLVLSEAHLATRRYWALDPVRERALGGDAEYAAAYRAAFVESVQDRLRSAGRVGAMLSGGLDSSSIAGVARHLTLAAGGPPLPVFNAVLTGALPGPDAPFLEAVLGFGGFEAHRVPWGDAGPMALAAASGPDDEPPRLPGLGLQSAVYAAAREAGCTVVLDGDSGDDVLSHGTARIAELTLAGHLAAAVRETNALERRTGISAGATARSWIFRPAVPDRVLRAWRRARGRDRWGCTLPMPLNPDFARSIDLSGRLDLLCGPIGRTPKSAREDHWRTLNSGLISHSLGVLDRTAAAAGIEPRYPFLDHRLMELCLAFPADQKLDAGWTRVVARRALAGYVPEEVLWRGGKAPTSGALLAGLLGPDRGTLEEVLLGKGPVWEYVDAGAIRKLAAHFWTAPLPGDALLLWLVASTNAWLEMACKPGVP